jgi:hypothetical protein
MTISNIYYFAFDPTYIADNDTHLLFLSQSIPIFNSPAPMMLGVANNCPVGFGSSLQFS